MKSMSFHLSLDYNTHTNIYEKKNRVKSINSVIVKINI